MSLYSDCERLNPRAQGLPPADPALPPALAQACRVEPARSVRVRSELPALRWDAIASAVAVHMLPRSETTAYTDYPKEQVAFA